MQIDALSNAQIVTIAVFLLGGEVEFIDDEDIAIKADEIAPGRFTWRKYPERIDLAAVGYALRDAKKAKSRGLLTGSTGSGWMLSPQGQRWIDALDLPSLLETDASKQRQHSVAAMQEAECVRLRTTRAYSLYKSQSLDLLDIQDFYQFARVNEYFQTKMRRKRFTALENAVAADPELSELWEILKERFPKEIT